MAQRIQPDFNDKEACSAFYLLTIFIFPSICQDLFLMDLMVRVSAPPQN